MATDLTATSAFEDGLAYVQIDYSAEIPDPARVFRTIAKFIDALYAVDRDLVRNISPGLEPVLYLERVDTGSIRAWLRTAILQLDDEALKTLDWKPLVGQYLVRAKHHILRRLGSDQKALTREGLRTLQRDLVEISEPVSPNVLLVQPIPFPVLIEDLRVIAEATDEMEPGDRVTYVSADQETQIPRRIEFATQGIEELLTDDFHSFENQLVLLVKKPDYLGSSRWEFIFEDHIVEARIEDEAWLESFRSGKVELRPGYALRAVVRTEILRGLEGNVVATNYSLTQILEVIPVNTGHQGAFDLQ